MSFCSQEDIFNLVEGLVNSLLKVAGIPELKLPLYRLPYQEALERYGTDRPDTRFGLEIVNLDSLAATCSFQVFKKVSDQGGSVRGINVKRGASFSRKELEELTLLAREWGAGGLAWIMYTSEGWKSPIVKFFQPGELDLLQAEMAVEEGDLLLFIADYDNLPLEILGRLRLHLAKQLNLIQDLFLKFKINHFFRYLFER